MSLNLLLAISGVLMLFCVFANRISDRYDIPALLLFLGLGMLAVACLTPDSSLPALVSLTLFVSVLGASQTAGFGIVMASRSGGAGAASGIFGVLCFLFGALMSPLVGLMGETSMLPLALCLVVSALISFILFNLGLKLKQPLTKEIL